MTDLRSCDTLLRRLREGPPVIAPGVWDGLSARMAQEAGFTTAFISSTVTSASWGLPDMHLLTLSELRTTCEVVRRSSSLELVVDLDCGYGGPTGIRRAVGELALAGAAGYQIEDQAFPRRWGGAAPGAVVPLEEMLLRIKAGRAADPSLVMIARTDCLEHGDLDAAIMRSIAYKEAGADLVWVNAITRREDIARVAEALAPDIVYNVAGTDTAPSLGWADARALGISLVLYPMHAARAAALAAQSCYRSIGHDQAHPGSLITYTEYRRLTRWDDWTRFEDSLRPGAGVTDAGA